MSLAKQSIAVKFDGGVDTKTAEQLVVPGSFLALENCVRRKTGRIEKRNGFEQLSQHISGLSDTITTGKRIDTFKSDVLLLEADRLYSYIESQDIWSDRGQVATVLVDSDPMVRNSFKQALPDVAYIQGLTVTVYEDSRTSNSVRYTIIDDSTGATIVYDALVATTAERPKVVAVNGNTFLIGYRNTATDSLGLASISISNPDSLTTLTTVQTGAFIAGPWDFVTDRQFAIAAFNITGSSIRLCPVNYLGAIGTGVNGMPIPLDVAYAGTNGLCIHVDDTASNYYVAAATSTGVRTIVAPNTLITSYAAGTEVAHTNVRNLTITSKLTGTALIYLEHGNPATVAARKNQQVSSIAITYAGSTVTQGSLTSFKRSVGLASKAWTVGTTIYVTCVFDSSFQATYFVIKEDGYIVAKAAQGLAGGLTQSTADALKTGLPSITVDSQGRYITMGRHKNALAADADGTIVSTSVGIQRLSYTFDGTDFDTAVLGDNYHIAGGIMLAYDGVSATEQNFHQYPEDVSASAGGSGTLPVGDYYYAAIYEWQDAKGQIHRSAPSVNVVQAASGTNIITVTVPTLRLTLKTGTRADAKIVLYSGTVGDDQILYRLAETTNDTTSDTVAFQETAPRAATFTSGEVLYTTGGVIESIAPPASKVITAHKNRLFLGGQEDGLTVSYTREQVFGEGACFSDFLSLRVDPRGGPVTALASLDDKLVVFKQDAIFILVGDGPVDTGAQNDYGQPQLLSSDVGCVSPKSIATIPNGLLFKSDKGIYLLDRGMSISYIGDRVENYNAETISSAVVLEDTNEVRFTTEAGPCLVYNYYFNQWSTFSNYEAVSAVRGLNSYLHLKSTGEVRKENAEFNDAGSRYSMSIETSWFSFADLQGYQRVYYIMGLGDYLSNHHTQVKMAYDFEDAYSETVYFNVDNGLDISYYGDDATYGDSDVYGGSGSSIYQWYLRPRRQKCQSIKLLIKDIDTISTAGSASFNFVGLTMMAGIKNGGPRVGSGKEIGGS